MNRRWRVTEQFGLKYSKTKVFLIIVFIVIIMISIKLIAILYTFIFAVKQTEVCLVFFSIKQLLTKN